MRTLPEPNPNVQGLFLPTAFITFRDGDQWWLANDYDEIAAAIGEGAPFEAHRVKGMKAFECVINPREIRSMERERS